MRSKLVFATATVLLCLTACDKPVKDLPAPQSGQLTAKIDGVVFRSTLVTASQNVDSHIFGLTSKDDKGNVISITTNGTVGVHDSATDPDTGGIYVGLDGLAYISSNTNGSATITLTKYDLVTKKMSGSFSFTAPASNGASSKTITEGSFTDVSFTVL